MSTKHLLLIGGAAIVAYALYSRHQGTATLPVASGSTYGVTSSALTSETPLIATTDSVVLGQESMGASSSNVVASPSALSNLVPGTPGTTPKDKTAITPVMWGGGTGASHPLEF